MDLLDGRFFIGNRRVESGERITVENPATLEPVGQACLASAPDCLNAVEAAKEAFRVWGDFSPREKQKIFLAAKHILLERADEISRLITIEKGTPLLESLSVEVLAALEDLDYYGRHQGKTLAPRKARTHVPLFAHKKSAFLFQPVGPTLVISPWNFPFMIPILDVTSALAAGNTVVLRPSSSTPFAALLIGEIYAEAGLPAGTLNIVPCRVPHAEEMITNPDIQSVVFTGSVRVGKRIMELASRNLTKVVLELGGKDPMIVLKDADLEEAARGAVWAGFMNSGQSCAAIERVYVAREIADKFLARVVELSLALRVGNPLEPGVDIGPMENPGQLAVVEEHVREATEKGAEILCGGKRPDSLPGYFFLPTVMSRVNHTMRVMTQETFGPVLPVMPFSDVDRAVALANDSRYGLTASVWTKDRKTAARLAERLEVGSVTVNDHMFSFTEPTAIWGGIKETGRGRTHGGYGLLELANIKFISADFAGKRERTWWFPYAPARRRVIKTALVLLHGRRFSRRLKALLAILPRLGTVRAGTPFLSLLKIASRLFRG
jgi:acyl-CoA reductase-like NAD-dependent aldehyde dehydrogenase